MSAFLGDSDLLPDNKGSFRSPHETGQLKRVEWRTGPESGRRRNGDRCGTRVNYRWYKIATDTCRENYDEEVVVRYTRQSHLHSAEGFVWWDVSTTNYNQRLDLELEDLVPRNGYNLVSRERYRRTKRKEMEDLMMHWKSWIFWLSGKRQQQHERRGEKKNAHHILDKTTKSLRDVWVPKDNLERSTRNPVDLSWPRPWTAQQKH
jgi:hypothetical protein